MALHLGVAIKRFVINNRVMVDRASLISSLEHLQAAAPVQYATWARLYTVRGAGRHWTELVWDAVQKLPVGGGLPTPNDHCSGARTPNEFVRMVTDLVFQYNKVLQPRQGRHQSFIVAFLAAVQQEVPNTDLIHSAPRGPVANALHAVYDGGELFSVLERVLKVLSVVARSAALAAEEGRPSHNFRPGLMLDETCW